MSKLKKSLILVSLSAAAILATPLAASAQYHRPAPEQSPTNPPGDWCELSMGGGTPGGTWICD